MRRNFFITAIFIFCLFSFQFSFSQTADWREIEQFIHSQHNEINSEKDLDVLAVSIQQHFNDSLSRLKAVYAWVTENISYDVEGSEQPRYINSIDSVLKYKTAVCSGYVNVFVLLCGKVGITCKEVGGYGRSGMHPFEVNEKFKEDHSWAAAWLRGKWNLIDVTWGSGYTLEGSSDFIRNPNDWFFFTDPARFIWDHYPRDPQWQLLTDTVSWTAFKKYPIVSLGARENLVQSFSPVESILQTQVGKNIEFAFTTDKILNGILLISKEGNFTEKGGLEKKGNTYYYTFKVPYNGFYDLRIDLFYLGPEARTLNNSLIDFVYFINAASANRN